jgi:hypothetical protein
MNQTRHDELDATRVSNRVADLPAFFLLTEVTNLVFLQGRLPCDLCTPDVDRENYFGWTVQVRQPARANAGNGGY